MAAVELSIDDVIADSWWGGVSARYVNAWLKENASKAKEITVLLNTPGGDVFEGIAIYNALKNHPANVTMHVVGLAASAGSLIAMAGDKISIAKGAFMMIHEAWGFTQGPAEDHEKHGNLLRKINGQLAELYSARTGQSVEKCIDLMAANETWLTADEAKALGFCDDVLPAKAGAAAAQQGTKQAENAARVLASYKRTPMALLGHSLNAGPSRRSANAQLGRSLSSPSAQIPSSAISIGDRVKVSPGLEHMDGHSAGTVAILHSGPAVGIVFDGMDTVHKWYVPDELDQEASDQEASDDSSKPKKMRMGVTQQKTTAVKSPLAELAPAKSGFGDF